MNNAEKMLDTTYCIGKRILYEEKKWAQFNNTNRYLGIHKLTNKYNVYLSLKNISGYKNILFKFDITDYPFKAPRVSIVDTQDNFIKSYFSIFQSFNTNFVNEIRNIIGRSCMCCNTILCGDNWNPNYTIIDIAKEIIQNFNTIQRVKTRLTLKTIINKSIHTKLNNDVLKIILNFL